MPKKPPVTVAASGDSPSRASSRTRVSIAESTIGEDLKDGGRTALALGKSAGRRITTATKSIGKRLGNAAVRVSDQNRDGKVDQEDAKIAAGKAKRVTSKVADGAGRLAKKAGQHDMVKDAAAGAAIGAAVALPIPVIGPAAGAAVGAIVGVAKNLKSATNRTSATPGEQPASSTAKPVKRRFRKAR